jgi:microcystin-dependent protein
MSEPFLAEIKIVSFNFPPRGWAFCDGQILPINQNQALFSLVGTTYGGDGRVNFALPDLRGRAAMHVSSSHNWGERSGEENHTLSIAELPQHGHGLSGSSSDADSPAPAGALLGKQTATEIYTANAPGTPLVQMSQASLAAVGGSQSHQNRQPFLALNFVIALQGIFPSRS